MTVRTGGERLVAAPSLIPGNKWGFVTNYTAVLPDQELVITALRRKSAIVKRVFSPEHGLRGTAQAGFSEQTANDPLTGLPVVDTYGLSPKDLRDSMKGLDAVVADIQDVGARLFTYAWTVLDCMRAAAGEGIPFYVLDRPNPLSGAVRGGPGLEPACESFVGRMNVPLRHGLTLGELMREAAAREGLPQPEVVTMVGWRRSMYWPQTGLEWVLPSPNLPTFSSALVYPGTALLEGTNLSEGRGTTKPFQLVGAPWLSESFARALRGLELPGVTCRADWFQPTFQKYSGETLGGAELYVTDVNQFDPVGVGVAVLQVASQLSRGRFSWRMPEWDTSSDRRPFVDLLWGSPVLREGLSELTYPELLQSSPKPAPLLTELLYQ